MVTISLAGPNNPGSETMQTADSVEFTQTVASTGAAAAVSWSCCSPNEC